MRREAAAAVALALRGRSCGVDLRPARMADERSGWPDDFAAVFAHALPERLIAAAAAESDAMAAVEENFWVPREVIEPVRRCGCRGTLL